MDDDDLNQRAASVFDINAEEKKWLQPNADGDEDDQPQGNNTLALTNMQDHFMEIMNNEQVEDVIDLNEKFLAMALGGIDVNELALLPKLELRVDTTCHSL